MSEIASILRLHIVGVGVAAALVFAWLLTGEYWVAAAVVGGVDWLFINLLNRVTDTEEDRLNVVLGAERLARRPRLWAALALGALAATFALTHALWPELTVLRAIVQAIGLGYSFRLVPTPSGLRRFKDLYFLKNFLSAVLFCLTAFGYPLALAGGPVAAVAGWASVALLMAFFVPFELTYEILYDLRDLVGDRAARVPTYPVVHGPERARQIIDVLLVLSLVPLIAGFALGALGVREALMAAAPGIQWAFYRPRYRRGLTGADCVLLTHLGTALLVFYLVGTRVWLALGLPANVVLGG